MKILFVTDLCPIDKDEEGLPTTLLEFIKDFKKLGHEVILFRPNVIPNVLLRGRKILPEGDYVYKGIHSINKNYLTPFFTKSQFNFLKKSEFDIILSHMPSGILAANKISKLINVPYFAAVHASDIEVLESKRYSFLWHTIKNAYLEAKHVVCRSYWLKDKIETIIPELKNKTYIIPSGIEARELLTPVAVNSKADKIGDPSYKIFTAGKLIKRKNFSALIEAVSKFQDVTLQIAGDGSEKKALEKLIKKYKLTDKVKLLGKLKRFEVYEYMRKAPIFILPSKKETFGMVYLEAMAKGSIVVCTKNSGMAGFIKDGYNGFLTDFDTSSLIDVINKIKELKNPEKIMQNALNTASDMEKLKMASNYLNLIQNILF